MSHDFLERIAAGPLLCDGATGTMLYSKGVGFERCFDALNLHQPAVVAEVHRDYIAAGADIIETNTFGANRFKLAEHGLDDRVADINGAGVELVRRVVGASFKDVLIAGSVGPIGARLAPLGRLQPAEAYDIFREQIQALIWADVDVLMFETFGDLLELEQAVAAARFIHKTIPIVAQITFTNDGLTPLGDSPARAAETLARLPVDMVGINCSVGPARVLRSLNGLIAHLPAGTKLAAQPNAGWPQHLQGRLMYPATADYFAEYVPSFRAAGVSLFGGCCGTTPAHIAKMRQAIDEPQRFTTPIHTTFSPIIEPASVDDTSEATQLSKKLAAGEFVTSVELKPPRGFSVAKVLAAAEMLKEAGVTAVNVADSPVAQMRMSPWAVCHLIQGRLGLETILNFPTRGRNLLRIQGDLLAAHALNIRNLFVVMGDPTALGDYPQAFDHHDVVPTGLIQLVKHGFNSGVDYAGKAITEPTNFLVGCALNLNADNPDREVTLLKKKIDSGADFAMTQAIYQVSQLTDFVARYEAVYGRLTLPIIVSVLPLASFRHAEFLHNEVPGIIIPAELRAKLAAAGEEGQEAGLQLAQELVAELKGACRGIYIMPPFQKYHLAAEILEALK